MFISIQHISLDKMRGLTPRLDTVVVSILDLSESPRRPALGGWRSTLSLTFEDTFEECKASSSLWPAEPSDEEHTRYAQGQGERVPSLSDAATIVKYLTTHGHSPEQLHLLVHCYAGVSRSGAVAQWASARFFVPLEREPLYPNLRLLRLLSAAQNNLST